MSDWQPGDLALCVRGGMILPDLRVETYPKGGALYTVAGVGEFTFGDGHKLALWLADGPDNAGFGAIWASHRFRKVTPPKADADDLEVIALMNARPVEEPSERYIPARSESA